MSNLFVSAIIEIFMQPKNFPNMRMHFFINYYSPAANAILGTYITIGKFRNTDSANRKDEHFLVLLSNLSPRYSYVLNNCNSWNTGMKQKIVIIAINKMEIVASM